MNASPPRLELRQSKPVFNLATLRLEVERSMRRPRDVDPDNTNFLRALYFMAICPYPSISTSDLRNVNPSLSRDKPCWPVRVFKVLARAGLGREIVGSRNRNHPTKFIWSNRAVAQRMLLALDYRNIEVDDLYEMLNLEQPERRKRHRPPAAPAGNLKFEEDVLLDSRNEVVARRVTVRQGGLKYTLSMDMTMTVEEVNDALHALRRRLGFAPL